MNSQAAKASPRCADATANQAFEQITKASTAAMSNVGETVKKAAAGAKRK